MSVTRIAERYATAILNTATASGKVESVDRDLQMISESFKTHSELRAILRSPVVSPFHKKRILDELWAKTIDPLTLDFLKVVIHKGRGAYLLEIVEAFNTRYDTQQKFVRVEVTSAVELSERERQSVLEAISTKTQKKALGTFQVNAAVLGGISIRIGDTVMDGTLKRQLEQLRNDLATKQDERAKPSQKATPSL